MPDDYAVQPVLRFGHHGVRSLQPVACLLCPACKRAYNVAGGLVARTRHVATAPPRH